MGAGRASVLLLTPSLMSGTVLASAPPPWNLKGTGIILIYKFSKDWVEKHGMLPSFLKDNFKGGLGYLMLVNYTESPVGPYKELLLIPGKFAPKNKQSISKIYVSSEASTINGRANWGIPKDTLPFTWDTLGGVEKIQMHSEGRWFLIAKSALAAFHFLSAPLFYPLICAKSGKIRIFIPSPLVRAGENWPRLKSRSPIPASSLI